MKIKNLLFLDLFEIYNLSELDELCQELKIIFCYDDIDKLLVKLSSLELSLDNKKDLSILARIINPNDQKWNKNQLTEAINFNLDFVNNYQLNLSKLNFKLDYGYQTPSKIDNINIFLKYKIIHDHSYDLKIHNYNLNLSLILQYQSLAYLKNLLIIKLTNVSENQELIKTLNDINNLNLNFELNSKPLTSLSLQNYYQKIKTNMNKYIIPTNNVEAIVLSALLYNNDISFSNNPMYQYLINQDNQNKKLDLKTNFNSLFPECFYQRSDLNRMCLKEGYRKSELTNQTNLYQLLQQSYLSENLYHGVEIYLLYKQEKQSITPFLYEEVDYDQPDNYFCYGNIYDIKYGIKIYSYHEIIMCFEHNLDYYFPDKSNYLSSRLIKKLKIMAKNISNLETSKRLTTIINKVKKFKDNNTLQDKIIIQKCNSNSDLTQTVREIFDKLFILCLTMRGYIDGQEYPLYYVPTSNNNQTMINLTEKYNNFNKLSNLEMFDLILNLPLYDYKINQNYVNLISEDEGLTIKGRLDIIFNESETNSKSCIRVSSNVLLFTLNYHSKLILDHEYFVTQNLKLVF